MLVQDASLIRGNVRGESTTLFRCLASSKGDFGGSVGCSWNDDRSLNKSQQTEV